MVATQQKSDQVNHDRLDAVRERYAKEAAKRIRPEGLGQFLQLRDADEERLRALVEDPWVDHERLNAQNPPIKDSAVYPFFIVGAGFGGLQFAVRLITEQLASPDDIRLADAAGGFGGTWYWNRFPGLHCDVESYVYLPLLEETGYIPKNKYSSGEEIRTHAERIAAQWHLADKALFRSDVKNVEWDNKTQLWTVRLTELRGPKTAPVDRIFYAQYVYLAAGILTRPQIPKIPGVLSFSGPIFHTSRWNYTVSGGSPADQTLLGFQGKKVAVIGTAATAIGVIPEIAKFAGELYVVQRTPAYVKRRDQRQTDLEEFRAKIAVKKGWQFERQLNFTTVLTNPQPPVENLVGDGWTDSPAYSAVMGSPTHGIVDPSPENIEKHITQFHALDLPHMEAVRDRVDQVVEDSATASKLKPWYPSWCKRPTFSDTYLQAFNQPNVHLLDTDGKGISGATENGIIVGDKEYPVDIIIFGTGYRAPGYGLGSPAARTGVEILGQRGQSLDKKWQADGAETLHGYAASGFPNLFFSSSNQAVITGNNIFMLGLIADHIAYIIGQAARRVGAGRRAVVEVTPEGEEAHTGEILKRAAYFAPLAGCTPGYFNSYGEGATITDPKEKIKRAKGSVWSEGTLSFLNYIRKWREEESLRGLSVLPASNRTSSL